MPSSRDKKFEKEPFFLARIQRGSIKFTLNDLPVNSYITDIKASRSSVGMQSLTQWFCAIVYSLWFAKTNVSWIYFKLVFLKCSKSQVFEIQSTFSPKIKKVTTPSMKTSSIKYQKPDTNRIVGFKSHFQIAGLYPTPSLSPARQEGFFHLPFWKSSPWRWFPNPRKHRPAPASETALRIFILVTINPLG